MSAGEDDTLDVAIVGGGVAGLYAGWRLTTAPGPQRRVALFEQSDRIGGRLLSVQPPGIENTRVELGGMRYSTSHTSVCALVEHFRLRADPFPVEEPQNIAYLRGKFLRLQDLPNADLLPYNLRLDERSPATLKDGFTAEAAKRLVRAMTGKDIPLKDVDWRKLALNNRFEEQRLRDLTIRYVMLRNLSSEAFAFEEDSSGYDSILFTWNAADGLPWNLADFGRDVKFWHLHDGFDSVARALASEFASSGGETRMQHRLTCFHPCRLADGTRGVQARFRSGESETTVRARHLILAMPKRALELVGEETPFLGRGNTAVRELIDTVTPIPLFKLAICYDYPWWQTVPEVAVCNREGAAEPKRIEQGRSVTDLPLRQCYYWATDKASGKSAILIYDDGRDLDYWAGLRDSSEAPAAPAEAGSTEWDRYPAPPRMVAEVHRQLVEMHGLQHRTDVPQPCCAAYRDWGEDPYGGGANFWHLGVDSHRSAEKILQPDPEMPVYICGEAYSHFQGWVEGALRTTEALLERCFSLPPPLRTPSEVTKASFAHMCIVVADLEKAVAFFVDDLGCSAGAKTSLAGPWVDALCHMEHVRTELVPLTWEETGTKLFLLKYLHPSALPGRDGRPNRAGYNHANIVVDDIDALVARLSKKGWCFLSTVQNVPDLKLKTVYFHGPEQILIQLTQYFSGQ